jgi:hypothetical protein
MKKHVSRSLATALFLLTSPLLPVLAKAGTAQYLVVTGIDVSNGPEELQALLNAKSQEGWRLHSFNPIGGVTIFIKE